MENEQDRMLTAEEVARQFYVHPRTVVRMVNEGQLKALRVGRQWRFKQDWIDQWIERNQMNRESEAE